MKTHFSWKFSSQEVFKQQFFSPCHIIISQKIKRSPQSKDIYFLIDNIIYPLGRKQFIQEFKIFPNAICLFVLILPPDFRFRHSLLFEYSGHNESPAEMLLCRLTFFRHVSNMPITHIVHSLLLLARIVAYIFMFRFFCVNAVKILLCVFRFSLCLH